MAVNLSIYLIYALAVIGALSLLVGGWATVYLWLDNTPPIIQSVASTFDHDYVSKQYVDTLVDRLRHEDSDIYDMLGNLGIRVNGLECTPKPRHPADKAALRNFITVRDNDYNFSHYVYKIKTEE
jgi:hypothetical protein